MEESRENARTYEQISSVRKICNGYVQIAIKHRFKKTSGEKARRNQYEAELIWDHITVSAIESVTPLKLQKAGYTGD